MNYYSYKYLDPTFFYILVMNKAESRLTWP